MKENKLIKVEKLIREKKIDRWLEAKPIISGWGKDQIKQKREECRTWWNQYKNKIQEFTINKINL